MNASSELSWDLAPGAEQRLAPFRASGAESWPLRSLRRTPRREAYCAQPAGAGYLFVKAFLPRHALDKPHLAQEARAEWASLKSLARSGLRVPQPLALACANDGRAWIFQEWVEGTPWDRLEKPASRKALRGLAKLLRALHDQGLRDPDRHGGNFLLGAGEDSWAVDFQKARQGAPLSKRERIDALALVHASLLGGVAARGRARLLREYWKPERGFREFALAVETSALRRRVEAFRRKTRQACSEGRRFERFSWQGYRGWRRRDVSARRLEEAFSLWEAGRSQRLKGGRRTEVLAIEGDPQLVVKVYRHPGLFSRLRNVFGFGRARRAWKRAFQIELAGNLGAKAWGCLEGAREDLLFTERIADGTVPAAANSELGEFLARLHLAGLRTRDLRPENLLLVAGAHGREIRLVDFDGLSPWKSLALACEDWGRFFAAMPESTQRERASCIKAYARRIFGIAHPRTVARMMTAAQAAESRVRGRWRRQGKT